mmetsp:Transcript_14087/g.23039  ORF Transcript_14087/g.23039 Transcript_14087/m.23039 type:complete len:222 (+) Transcript_14087:993-1658(+)
MVQKESLHPLVLPKFADTNTELDLLQQLQQLHSLDRSSYACVLNSDVPTVSLSLDALQFVYTDEGIVWLSRLWQILELLLQNREEANRENLDPNLPRHILGIIVQILTILLARSWFLIATWLLLQHHFHQTEKILYLCHYHDRRHVYLLKKLPRLHRPESIHKLHQSRELCPLLPQFHLLLHHYLALVMLLHCLSALTMRIMWQVLDFSLLSVADRGVSRK